MSRTTWNQTKRTKPCVNGDNNEHKKISTRHQQATLKPSHDRSLRYVDSHYNCLSAALRQHFFN